MKLISNRTFILEDENASRDQKLKNKNKKKGIKETTVV